MFIELGHFALALAMMVAAVQSIVPLVGAQRGSAAMMAVAKPAALVQLVLVLSAFAALMHAFVTSDFSVVSVYQNSHSLKPLIYKISGVWGNHEGSLVLWVAILAIFGGSVALFGDNLPPSLKARALAVQGMIGVGFIAFILFTSNPFLRILPAPADGMGLNPQLQDPGLAIHPPMLYLGYVGFSMAFSFAVAALIEGRVDAAWARWVRPWTLAAWAFLTVGIGLGSWWAYYTLGWGGYWFWDPVENASFVPWLTGTALLHSAIVVEKREALKSWTILLALVTFSLSMLGTFLVRSGVITSVHAFASDPTRGVFILALLAIAIGGSLTLYAIRAPRLQGGGLFAPISREGGLLINNLLLATAAATVLLGTLYPLITEVLSENKISVGAPYFNGVFIPLMTPLIILMGFGPRLAWKRGDLKGALDRVKIAAAAAVAMLALSLLINGASITDIAGAAGLAMATWLAVATIGEWVDRVKVTRSGALSRIGNLPRAAYGMTAAHLGMAVLIAGVSASSAWKQERIQTMAPGQAVEIAGFTMTFEGVEMVRGPNYEAGQSTIVVTRNGDHVTTMHPELRMYSNPPQQLSYTNVHTTFTSDLHAVLGEPQGADGAFVVRFYYEPLVPFMWYGILLMAFGGLLSLTDRRHRIGAPQRATQDMSATSGAAPAPAAAE
jgi:cytochrome c-type biogenesis protein CcmF